MTDQTPAEPTVAVAGIGDPLKASEYRRGLRTALEILALQKRQYEQAEAIKERKREGSGHRERRKMTAIDLALTQIEGRVSRSLKDRARLRAAFAEAQQVEAG